MLSVILPLRVHVRAGNVLSNLLVARYFFILSVLLNDIYVFSIKVNSKMDGEVDEMLDVLGVMMEVLPLRRRLLRWTRRWMRMYTKSKRC